MDKTHIPALTSQMPLYSIGGIAHQRHSCEPPLHPQFTERMQQLNVAGTPSGETSVSSTMQATANPTLGSEVNYASAQSSFSLEPLISSLAALQITTDAEAPVDSSSPLSLTLQSTNANGYNTDWASHDSSRQEVLRNFHQSTGWDGQAHSCEGFEGNCILCCPSRMFQYTYVTNEAENGLDLTLKSSASATSSRESVPPGALHPGHHQGVWPRDTSGEIHCTASWPNNSAISSFPSHLGYNRSVPDWRRSSPDV